jgi:hypothetical protein
MRAVLVLPHHHPYNLRPQLGLSSVINFKPGVMKITRYLLIEVDSKDTAERLRAQIDKATASNKGLRLAGLFISPDTHCTCPRDEVYYRNGIVRGSRLGWWIHRNCRKARLGSHSLINLITPKSRKYAKESGYVHMVDSITVNVGEVLVQNLR